MLMKMMDEDVLLVIDMQNDFLPNGALAVKDGDAIIPLINRLGEQARHVIFTQDWHPKNHASFASGYPGKKPFETIQLPYGEQTLWPDHCVQGTYGASLAEHLAIPQAELIIRKGFHLGIDSYSAFMEADRHTKTGLASYLHERDIKRVFCTGLATDYCVGWTALDAKAAGFDTFVIEDACRAIDLNGSLEKTWQQLAKVGVKRVKSEHILG